MANRDRRLSIRIGDEERKMLDALAKRDGLTVSDYVRLFARRAYAEAFPATRVPKKR
jgi:uncharacterized protein (DUF1778 family)